MGDRTGDKRVADESLVTPLLQPQALLIDIFVRVLPN